MSYPSKIETERLILRCFEKGDLDAHVEILSDWNVTQWASKNIPFPYKREDGEKYIEEAQAEFASEQSFRFSIIEKAGGCHMGNIRLFKAQQDKSEVGYGLGPKSWGKGYATEALKAVVDFAFEGGVIHFLHAQTSVKNGGSRRVLEKAGFMHIGDVPKEYSRCGHADGCSEFYALKIEDWCKVRGSNNNE